MKLLLLLLDVSMMTCWVRICRHDAVRERVLKICNEPELLLSRRCGCGGQRRS